MNWIQGSLKKKKNYTKYNNNQIFTSKHSSWWGEVLSPYSPHRVYAIDDKTLQNTYDSKYRRGKLTVAARSETFGFGFLDILRASSALWWKNTRRLECVQISRFTTQIKLFAFKLIYICRGRGGGSMSTMVSGLGENYIIYTRNC